MIKKNAMDILEGGGGLLKSYSAPSFYYYYFLVWRRDEKSEIIFEAIGFVLNCIFLWQVCRVVALFCFLRACKPREIRCQMFVEYFR